MIEFQFTLYCFSKVLGLTYSGNDCDLANLFSGSTSPNSIVNLITGKTNPKKYIDWIDVTSEQALKTINRLSPTLITHLHQYLLKGSADNENVPEMVASLLAYSLTLNNSIQKQIYDNRFAESITSAIFSLQQMKGFPTRAAAGVDSDISSITLEESYVLRLEEINHAEGDIYIYGSTLKDAFSTVSQTKEISIIRALLENQKIDTINIFLLNYVYLNIKGEDGNEDGSEEIVRSIVNFLGKIKTYSGPMKKINIILLSDLHMQFALLTSNTLITRSTYLFTKDRSFKGQYFVYSKHTTEYEAQRNYMQYLVEHSYEVDLNSKKESAFQVKNLFASNYKIRKYVSLRKVHPVQLYNLSRATFSDEDTVCETKPEDCILPDQNQSVLLKYLKATQEILDVVIQQHDKNGYARIIPSVDLGMPNNVTRIAGGFLTGALYDWKCSVPIIPVDATVNTCTSSIFSLAAFDEAISDAAFSKCIHTLTERANENGYALNFLSGNHFLTIAKDDSGHYYLVLHSSAKECKESCFGLYPSERVWYKDYIKTYINKDQNRYLRYIRGDVAVRFYDYAERFKEYNQEIHCFIAEEFARILGTSLTEETKLIRHHYGMPTANSIVIGTFAVDLDSYDRRVPIFSDYGRDFCIFKPKSEQPYTHRLIGTFTDVAIVPHGWGQVYDKLKNIDIQNLSDESARQLRLWDSESSYLSLPVNSSARIVSDQKHIRSCTDIRSFVDSNKAFINGDITCILHPLFTYCKRTSDSSKFKITGE